MQGVASGADRDLTSNFNNIRQAPSDEELPRPMRVPSVDRHLAITALTTDAEARSW